jgi:hypothetical protein
MTSLIVWCVAANSSKVSVCRTPCTVMFKSFEHLRRLSAVCSRGIVWFRAKACGWMIIQRCYYSHNDTVCDFFFQYDNGGGSDKGLVSVDRRFSKESRMVGSDAISQQPRYVTIYHQAQMEKRDTGTYLSNQIRTKSTPKGCNRRPIYPDPNPTNPGDNGWIEM